jgi:predicted RNA methylase
MAAMFPTEHPQHVHVLDAGAGLGALSCAFIEHFQAENIPPATLEVTAVELDAALVPQLTAHLTAFDGIQPHILNTDFIQWAAGEVLYGQGGYTHAILNPPYGKIGAHSPERRTLRKAGIETVNLYTGFFALALALMAPGGHLVAIIPRSFCNGPYYRPFREYLLQRAVIRHIHLFDSRRTAFKDDAVLQENIIIHVQRHAAQDAVRVTTSSDDTFSDVQTHLYPIDRIIYPDDPERFIHIPTSPDTPTLEALDGVHASLTDLDVRVSTGPVVDFRLRPHLQPMPSPGSVPLLYPAHLSAQGVTWPIPNFKKANAILRNGETEKWLFPVGFYCVVRRFSSKEERRRVVATVVTPGDFDGADMLGFENHLNVFHDGKRGMPEALARGLTAYLNTTAVDEQFRRFNGHTQVNATDLKSLKYPSRATLTRLGEWAAQHPDATQTMLDDQLSALTVSA